MFQKNSGIKIFDAIEKDDRFPSKHSVREPFCFSEKLTTGLKHLMHKNRNLSRLLVGNFTQTFHITVKVKLP